MSLSVGVRKLITANTETKIRNWLNVNEFAIVTIHIYIKPIHQVQHSEHSISGSVMSFWGGIWRRCLTIGFTKCSIEPDRSTINTIIVARRIILTIIESIFYFLYYFRSSIIENRGWNIKQICCAPITTRIKIK